MPGRGNQGNLRNTPGVYRVHKGAITLANKIFRQEYYWPTANKEAGEFMKKYDICQRLWGT